jgi:hypothetical protein
MARVYQNTKPIEASKLDKAAWENFSNATGVVFLLLTGSLLISICYLINAIGQST